MKKYENVQNFKSILLMSYGNLSQPPHVIQTDGTIVLSEAVN